MTTIDRIAEIVCDTLALDRDEAEPTSRIVEDLGADSLDFTKILLECENAYSIRIPDDRAEKVETIADLAELVDVVNAGMNRVKTIRGWSDGRPQ